MPSIMPPFLSALKSNTRFAQVSRSLAITATFLFMFIAVMARQQEQGFEDQPVVQVITGVSLAVNTTTDKYINDPGVYSIVNIVSLKVKEEVKQLITTNFTAMVKLKIEYGDNPGSVNTINEQQLTVGYSKDPRSKYSAQNYIHFKGARYVKVTVLGPLPAPIAGFTIGDLLQVEYEYRLTRYYTLGNNVLPATWSSPAMPSEVTDEQEVKWTWPSGAGYTHTQLEWTWVEQEMESYYQVNNVLNENLLFRNNATRLDLPRGIESYKIPMLYGAQGKLYWRVRAVNIKKNGNRSDGPWLQTQFVTFAGHQSNLNWQATTTYAEEGKRKAVIQYFDGSLRSRQTVTKDNVTNTVIFGETMYDGQGRPAVSILPAPTTNTNIAFTGNLNRFDRISQISGSISQPEDSDPADYFDLQPVGLTPSSYVPPLLNISGSATAYYSATNPEKNNDRINQRIPDAEGYPFTVTRYTPDGTGRIMAQTGVGAAMQMGTGHETMYYYGTPGQEELDGLFGSEVGYYTHYSKNMVKDANGQMSVSYVDMHGRTIATALAGDAPANVAPLTLDATHYPGQSGTVITRNLLNKATNIVKNNSVEATNTILVPAATNYTFRYELPSDAVSLPVCPAHGPGNRCYDCLYDLEISITDESGDGIHVVKKYNNTWSEPDDDCATPVAMFKEVDNSSAVPSNIIEFTQLLQPGSYIVRKTLTLSESALEKHKKIWIEKAMCKTEQELIDSIKTVLEGITNCNTPTPLDCASCLADLGEYPAFKTAWLNSLGNPSTIPAELDAEILAAYNQAKSTCQQLCSNTSKALSTKRQLMLADMVPYSGQYAQQIYTPLPGVTTNNIFPKYNIFVSGSGQRPFFRNPLAGSNATNAYYNAYGQPDVINGNITSIAQDEYVSSFQQSWAEALLPRHPEYNRLRFAEDHLKESYNFTNEMLGTETWAAAVSKGYIQTNLSAPLPSNDPFYVEAPANKPTMENMVKDNFRSEDGLKVSMWQVAYGDVGCKTNPNLQARQDCYLAAPKLPSGSLSAPYNSLTTAQLDQVWLSFRNLYINERERQMNEYIHNSVPLADETYIISEKYKLHFPIQEQMAQQYNENGDWNWWPTTPGGAPNVPANQGNAPVLNEYSQRCESYVPIWRQALLQCTVLASHPNKEQILADITSQMVDVCKKGADASNPNGASEVAPGTQPAGSPQNFEQVINAVFATYSIPQDAFCNPYVIEYPKPRGKGPKFAPEFITVLEPCNCTRFNTLKTAAAGAGYNPNDYTSLNNYFKATFKDSISLPLFNAFASCSQLGTQQICRTKYEPVSAPCGSSNPCGIALAAAQNSMQVTKDSAMLMMVPTCPPGYHWDYNLGQCVEDGAPPSCPTGYHWDAEAGECVPDQCTFQCPVTECISVPFNNIALPTPQRWPDFMKCDYVPVERCLTCSSLSSYITEFKSKFPDPLNSAPVLSGNLTAADITSNLLLERFLNYRTGFQYGWLDYALAAQKTNCVLTNLAANASNNETVICAKKLLTDTAGVIQGNSPCQYVYNMAAAWGQRIYMSRLEALMATYEGIYRDQSLATQNRETFTVTYASKEYHYTLYYYDMAGNLVKTIAPKGVRPNYTTGHLAATKAARDDDNDATVVSMGHVMPTRYLYNSLNTVVAQKSPDGGTSEFWYDRLGRLAVSRNSKQLAAVKYSYTIYDELGRITEVGQKPQPTQMTQTISQDDQSLRNWIMDASYPREQMTITKYEIPFTPVQAGFLAQENLRGRVSYSAVQTTENQSPYHAVTVYTYDVHGNVDKLLQSYSGIPELAQADQYNKLIAYDYDLISGKVNMVSYQPGETDAFYHRYKYDAENRLIKVETSRDKILWERDATYQYFRHGSLARLELGAQRVQGIDYVYTLQGWLKGINTTNVGNAAFDMGLDGLKIPGSSNPTEDVARDALGFALHYYDETVGADVRIDYKAISGANIFARPGSTTSFLSLYNGNIGAISINSPGLSKGVSASTNARPLFYKYKYDQLNRIVNLQAYKGLDPYSNQWAAQGMEDYKEVVSYDPNGNIWTYLRQGTPATQKPKDMDQLSYQYVAGTNRLDHVDDAITASNYTEDLDDQAAGNYGYDQIGNLIRDDAAGITNIEWNVYGKILAIYKGSSTISYTYDAAGNRISKTVGGKTTIYVRDASGNVMSIYEKPANEVKQTEVHLYGSSRLGILKPETTASPDVTLDGGYGTAKVNTLTRGEKVYELTNHLGNVLSTISDRKIQHSSNNVDVDYWEADVHMATDYYPFGMQMPGRNVAVASNCIEELQDAKELVASSDLNSGVTSGGTGIYLHNGLTWRNQANGIVSVVNGAFRVENSGTSASDGMLVVVPTSLIEPFTTYIMECDIVELSPGITSYGINAQQGTGDPYRASTEQTGTGRRSIVFTTGGVLGTFISLRISARPSTAGLYMIVDNFSLKKYTSVLTTQKITTDFNNAVMSGVNVNDNGQLWKPFTQSVTSLSVDGTTDRKIKVNCTNVTDSRITSDFNLVGGKKYLVKHTIEESDPAARVYLQLLSRTGTGTWTYFHGGIFNTGSGNYQFNFIMPAGADQLRVEFLRQNTGGSWDGLTVPYTIDNFSITEIDPQEQKKVTVCDPPTGTEEKDLYRYGFNGKENDNDVKGEGNQQDYGMRIYDPRLGKFLSVDPLEPRFPWWTPYQFAGNMPTRFIDLDGLEPAEPGMNAGDIVHGESGQSWKWDGNSWIDNSKLDEVVVLGKKKKEEKYFGKTISESQGMINWMRQLAEPPETYEQALNKRVGFAINLMKTASKDPNFYQKSALYSGQFYAATLPLPWEPQVEQGMAYIFGEMLFGVVAWSGSPTFSSFKPGVNEPHIFLGEINSKGKAVGFHSELFSGILVRVKAILDQPNAQGVYRATIEVFDFVNSRWVEKNSTMFPKDWSKAKILNQIQSAYENMDMLKGNKWGGVSSSGIRIEGYLNGEGLINTAYPIFQ